MNIQVDNLAKRAGLFKSLGDERRAQGKYMAEIFKSMYELFKTDANLGAAALQRIIPDARSTRNPDGTVQIELPSQEMQVVDGKQVTVPSRDKMVFAFDPAKLDPEKKANLEGQWYDRFQKNKAVQDYSEVSRQYRNLKSVSSLGTAQGDIAIVYAFMKMLDPQGTVREGEKATAENSPGVSEQVRNMYNRALTQDAPIFGKPDSVTRKNFVTAAQKIYENMRSDVMAVGRDLVDLARRERLDPKNVITPVGDIAEKDFMLTDEDLLNQLRK
jgi:hypothetical protein